MPSLAGYTKAVLTINGNEIAVENWEIQMPDDSHRLSPEDIQDFQALAESKPSSREDQLLRVLRQAREIQARDQADSPPTRPCHVCHGTGGRVGVQAFYLCVNCLGSGRVLDIGTGPRGTPGPVGIPTASPLHTTDEAPGELVSWEDVNGPTATAVEVETARQILRDNTNAPTSAEQGEDMARLLDHFARAGAALRTELTQVRSTEPTIREQITSLIQAWDEDVVSSNLSGLVDSICELITRPAMFSEKVVEAGRVEHLLDVIEEATEFLGTLGTESNPDLLSSKYTKDTVEYRLLEAVERAHRAYQALVELSSVSELARESLRRVERGR